MDRVEGKTVVVGMSGGVDSSVAAAVLKEAGARVVGLFMQNWDSADGSCSARDDFEDVGRVCRALGIDYYAVNFVAEYSRRVFSSFIADYRRGLTPNPDVLCNREIKFDVFLEKALKLGADYLATGHYCRIGKDSGGYRLLKGRDPEKDQSYFLHAIKAGVLEKVVFPLGHLRKEEVRRRARLLGLATAGKKDSTGICFIGERNFKRFLSGYIGRHPGDFKTLSGEVVGRHDGCAYYTPGQRKGLGLGGPGEPWFVLGKDTATNTVFVGRGRNHPALYRGDLRLRDPVWSAGRLRIPRRCKAKIRYRGPDEDCSLVADGGGLRVVFDRPQWAPTPGQSVVFYGGDVCLGGAIIDEAA